MSSDFDSMLPPWLRGADMPDDDDRDDSPVPGDSPVDSDSSASAAVQTPGLPYWLNEDVQERGSLLRDTGELSADFLDASDNLPETAPTDLTYDQWLLIQQEASRPRSLEEEVPDLLNEDRSVSPFVGDDLSLPDTGELPDWFLGLEELDEAQAPTWYAEPARRTGSSPVVSTEESLPPTAPNVTPDLFASALPDVPNAPGSATPALDDMDAFFSSISNQRKAAIEAEVPPDLLQPLPDLKGDYDQGLSISFDDFDANLAKTDEMNEAFAQMSASKLREDIPVDLGEFEPEIDATESAALDYPRRNVAASMRNVPAMDDFEEPDLDDFAPVPEKRPDLLGRLRGNQGSVEATSPSPDAAPSEDALSWLNEINAIVGSVVSQDAERDEEYEESETLSPITTDYLREADNTPTASQAAGEEEPPDWLLQLQSLPEYVEPEGTPTPERMPEQKAPPDRSAPVIDFSEMDLGSYGASEVRTDTLETPEDPYANLFSEISSPKATPETASGRGKGDTIILSEDVPAQASMVSSALESPKSVQIPAEVEVVGAMPTDEVEATLFGGAGEDDIDDYFVLEELSTGQMEQLAATAPEEDLSWLQRVEFDADTASVQVDPVEQQAATEPEDDLGAVYDTLDAGLPDAGGGDEEGTAVGYAPTTGELSALFDEIEAVEAAEMADDDAAYDALFGNVSGEVAPEEVVRYAPTTGELNALFSEMDEESDEGESGQTFSQQSTSTDLLLSMPPKQDAQPEQLMPQNDDFDKLFAGMDNDSSGDESESLPNTGMLSGSGEDAANDEFVTPNEDELDAFFADLDATLPADQTSVVGQAKTDELPPLSEVGGEDLEALFAAFEDEKRSADVVPDAEAIALDFDDESFYSALGLGVTSPPEHEAEPPPAKEPDEEADGPDLDFLEGFGQPEMSDTTVISGEEHTSVWEEPETTDEWSQDDQPIVSAFSLDEEVPVEVTDQGASDWFSFDGPVDDFAPLSSEAAAMFGPAIPEEVSPPAEDLPDWLRQIKTDELEGVIGDVSPSIQDVQRPAFSEADIQDLDSFIAALDEPDTILPQSDALATPITNTAEIDLDTLFSSGLPDTSVTEPENAKTLDQAAFLDELQASVGEISAAAVARQMKDRPEGELSDRLQKLRQRSTDEYAAVTPEAETAESEEALSRVLAGVHDALAPAPTEFVFETGEMVSVGVRLSEEQRRYVSTLRELVGSRDEPIQTRAASKLSAIDLTYEAPHLQDAMRTEDTSDVPETEAVTVPAMRARTRTYRIDRLLLGLLLAVGIILPFYVPELRIGSLPPAQFLAGSREQQAFDQIGSLEQYDLVLVGLEYSPASAAELDLMTESLVRHILLQGARPIFISGNPFGVLRAQTFIDRVNADSEFLERIRQPVPLEANVEYYVARFLPGSAVGLRAFSEATAALLTVDINGQTTGLNLESLSNLALIVMITDRAEDVRAYAEQIAPLATRPLVVGVGYAAAPLAEPYSAAPESIAGLLVGYEDAVTYGSLLGDVDAVERGARPIRPQPPAASTPAPPEATSEAGATDAPGGEATAEATAEPTARLIAVVISADGANLRSGPGTDFNRIIGMARNTELEVLGYNESGDWVNVRLEDGTEGWVSAGLIVINEAASAPEGGANAPGGRIFLRPLSRLSQDETDEPAAATNPPRSTRQATQPEPSATTTLRPSATPTRVRPTATARATVTPSATPEPTLTPTSTPMPAAYSPDDPSSLRWYAMNMGIVISAGIIVLGMVTGILRSIFRRRTRS